MKTLITVLASAALFSAHGQSGGVDGAGSSGSSGGSSGSGSQNGGVQGSMGNRGGPHDPGERSSPGRDWHSGQGGSGDRFGANSNWYQPNGTAAASWNTNANQNFGASSNAETDFQGGPGNLDQTDQGAGARGLVTNRPPWSYTNQGAGDPGYGHGIGAGASTNRYRRPGLDRGTNFDAQPRDGAGLETNQNTGSGTSRINTNSNSSNPDR